MKDETELREAIDEYADMVRRICFIHLKNNSDTEDVFQDVFLKFAVNAKPFEDKEHEKAWLIRVTVNRCRDVLKSFFRKNTVPLDEACAVCAPADGGGHVMDAVLRLPEKYRDVVYLHYFEGYRANEIGTILGRNENTVYTWLARARTALHAVLGGDEDEE